MDQNDTTQTTDQQQTDTRQADATQSDQTQTLAEPVPQNLATTPATDPAQTQPANQTAPAVASKNDYIENVGGDMIGLLDEINGDDKLIQEVATEMNLDKEKVKTILAGILSKIDQGQLTAEDFALIMASTVADELTEEPAEEAK